VPDVPVPVTVPVVPVPTRMTLGRVAELLASPGLALFAQPRLLAELDQVKASGLSGCVLDETECPMRPAGSATATLPQPEIRLVAASGECECAHDVRRDAAGGWSADAPRSGPSSGGPRHYAISDDRLLLRIQAPESAVPSVNSALQLDALRVLESSTAGGIDWLVSLDEEEEEEVVERLERGRARPFAEGSAAPSCASRGFPLGLARRSCCRRLAASASARRAPSRAGPRCCGGRGSVPAPPRRSSAVSLLDPSG